MPTVITCSKLEVKKVLRRDGCVSAHMNLLVITYASTVWNLITRHNCQTLSGPKLFGTLMVFLTIFLEKVYFEQEMSQSRDECPQTNWSSIRHIRGKLAVI